jgi:hypothetical protein
LSVSVAGVLVARFRTSIAISGPPCAYFVLVF